MNVRLKDNIKVYEQRKGTFQFNECAIKSLIIIASLSILLDFNSMNVRLKGRFFKWAVTAGGNFNSMNVRLKACKDSNQTPFYRFQFNECAIKRKMALYVRE